MDIENEKNESNERNISTLESLHLEIPSGAHADPKGNSFIHRLKEWISSASKEGRDAYFHREPSYSSEKQPDQESVRPNACTNTPCVCYHTPCFHRSWRKRHPVLFFGGTILLALFLFSALSSFLSTTMSGPSIAIVNIEGAIMGSRDVNTWVEEVRKDSNIAGVLLRVDSPGGGVGASQEIYYAILRLAKVKPVVVSMGALAASGGYYVSLPARRIFAVPSTITGSIGVKMELQNLSELMKVIGVSSTTLASGDLKDAGNPFKEMTPEEKAYLQTLIDDMFNDFVGVVIKHRHLSREEVIAVADGRGITGKQALGHKLIDELGDMQDALAYLKKECGFTADENVQLIEGPVEHVSFLRRLIVSTIQSTLGEVKQHQMFLY